MTRTHVILDGLQDPALGRKLSTAWAAAGFVNAVDVAGQCAWIDAEPALDEAAADRAATIARTFGLEIRDRAGATFRADNDLAALRKQITYEYKSRLATTLMFGLPAISLHYLGPVLAGGGDTPRAMLYPWLFELLLVGWACVAAGWPIFWQGGLSLVRLRATADLLTSAIVLAAFVPSAIGVVAIVFTGRTWLAPPSSAGTGPMFYAAMFAVILAVLQRWLAHRAASRLSGRADLMLTGFGRLVSLWIIVTVVIAVLGGWRVGLAVGLVFPPCLSLGAINRWSPGWSFALPAIAFAALLLFGPRALGLGTRGMEIEIAAGFGVLMSVVMGLGWRGMKSAKPQASTDG